MLPTAADPNNATDAIHGLLSASQTEDSTPDEVTVDDPYTKKMEEEAAAKAEEAENAALVQIRKMYKLAWSPKRQSIIRRCLKAFEYLKNNPYGVMNYGSGEMDTMTQVLAGTKGADDPSLYQYNDNIYQMLCLSFMAALGPDVSKTRWMPDDPQNEADLSFMKQASTMMAFIERINDFASLQMLELLYLFCCGGYFTYVRTRVDAIRAGTTKIPVYEMQEQEIYPNRYLCSGCGAATPANGNPFVQPTCAGCGASVGQADYYPAETGQMPVQIDEDEQANSMTAVDVFCALNVEVDPDAKELSDSPLLDLVGEQTVAAVRAMYPEKYAQIAKGQFGDETSGGTNERLARERVSSPSVAKSLTSEEYAGTFSRCWIQTWAFSALEDEQMAIQLAKKYPKGVKLVTYGEDLVLEKRPESLLEKWTECRTVKGLGMYPFGVGDVALSVQDRVDDTANNIHIYQDRMALPPVLANANLVDANALGRQTMGGGRFIPVYPSMKTPGMRFNLSEAVWQPTFHADSQIYTYSQTLMTLMQLLTGIQPQIFGGGTQRGVDTASGQEQQLNTAMGRLMLFLTASRAEKARRAKLAVKCMASDIEGQKRIPVEGAVEGEYENAFILESEVQGEVHAFPQADQGFPTSYGEMRDRLIQLLGMVEKNPVLENMLSDPDMQKLFAIYLLPDGAKLPGDSARTKIKMTLQKLAQARPTMAPDPQTGQLIPMPSIMPDTDFDDMSMIEQIATDWANKNYDLATSNPLGFANVRAYFKMASHIAQVNQAKQAVLQAGAAGAGAPPQGGPGAQGAPAAAAA